MDDGKLHEQQGGRDRTDYKHRGRICGDEFPDVPRRCRKGQRGKNAASYIRTMVRASRFWARLGGSVESRTCRSSKSPVTGGAGGRRSRVADGAVLSDRAQRQLFRAVSIALSISSIKVSLSNGLLRKPKAPASIARVRVRSSGKAVMKMVGVRRPCANSNLCSSTPFRPGICTSVIKQEVSSRRGDRRNSSADANVQAIKPSDVARLFTA
jgi:hypothetical protein